jgi:hypothetical protein
MHDVTPPSGDARQASLLLGGCEIRRGKVDRSIAELRTAYYIGHIGHTAAEASARGVAKSARQP